MTSSNNSSKAKGGCGTILFAIILLAILGSCLSNKSASTGSTNQTSKQNVTATIQTTVKETIGKISDSVLIDNFKIACTDIGINPSEVTTMENKDDWVGGPRYTFAYKSTAFILYCNSDSTVNSINIGDFKIYDQGYQPLSVNDYIVDISTTTQLQVYSMESIKAQLKYPETADFPWLGWGFGRYADVYVVSGSVKAKNALGVESEISCYLEFEKNNESFSIVYFVMDGTVVVGKESVIPVIERVPLATVPNSSDTDISSTIKLTDGELGSYGKTVTIDDEEYIWYYVPAGNYQVTSKVSFGKLYVDKNKIGTNSEGYGETTNVLTINLSTDKSAQNIAVGSDEHIFLTIAASVELVPIG